MAGHLKLYMQPYASPGDVEIKTITGIAKATIGTFVEATKTSWSEGAKKASESWGNFLECETAANTLGNTSAQTFLVNTAQVQTISEY